jgi:hypothetical protein
MITCHLLVARINIYYCKISQYMITILAWYVHRLLDACAHLQRKWHMHGMTTDAAVLCGVPGTVQLGTKGNQETL